MNRNNFICGKKKKIQQICLPHALSQSIYMYLLLCFPLSLSPKCSCDSLRQTHMHKWRESGGVSAGSAM